MRTLEQLRDRLGTYQEAKYIYDENVGYIAWHLSTGDNIEALFLEVTEQRRGHGTELYRRMCQLVMSQGKRPYHSVFGFRLVSNLAAGAFYSSLGFKQEVLGEPDEAGFFPLTIYAGEPAVIMWTPWTSLLKRLRVEWKGDVP